MLCTAFAVHVLIGVGLLIWFVPFFPLLWFWCLQCAKLSLVLVGEYLSLVNIGWLRVVTCLSHPIVDLGWPFCLSVSIHFPCVAKALSFFVLPLGRAIGKWLVHGDFWATSMPLYIFDLGCFQVVFMLVFTISFVLEDMLISSARLGSITAPF